MNRPKDNWIDFFFDFIFVFQIKMAEKSLDSYYDDVVRSIRRYAD